MSGVIVLKPSGQEGAEACHPIGRDTGFELAGLIDGSSRLSAWKPVEFKVLQTDGRKKLRPVDAPWYAASILMFKPAVIRAIGSCLRSYGEFLPVICEDTEIVLYNPTRVVDALDEKRSVLSRFESGRIMMIDRYVFHTEKIANIDVFKLPMRASATYVSQRFVDLWTSHGLTGLDFVPVK